MDSAALRSDYVDMQADLVFTFVKIPQRVRVSAFDQTEVVIIQAVKRHLGNIVLVSNMSLIHFPSLISVNVIVQYHS